MATIRKTELDLRVVPNLTDYEATRAAFSWADMAALADGTPDGGCNIAYGAVDRHAIGDAADRIALRFLSEPDDVHDVTYAELARQCRKFTNVLRSLGVAKGEHLFVITGRIPELYYAVLGSLRNGTVVTPLFSAFGPEPIAARIRLGSGRILVTTESLYRRKIEPIRDEIPSLEHVLLVGEGGRATAVDGTVDLVTAMAAASEDAPLERTSADDVALIHFTSGTTGTPKGAIHVHGAVATHYATGLYALDLHPDDVFWCTADPGWVTGTSYGILTPLLHAVTSIVDEAEFDAQRWYRILQEQEVTVWYTAPTAIRMLMKARSDAVSLPALRFVASVGEPLDPEAVLWGKSMFGLPVHDNWWQTETGGIMIANTPAFDIKPGSMGRPLPGIEACLVERDADGSVRRDDNGNAIRIDRPDVVGELALRAGWPSMFRGYLNQEGRYRSTFVDGFYLTGDLATRDSDGYYWFVGRADDVIKSAGHLIGPFEVESVLVEHPAVTEAAVIGMPDATVGQVVTAFVVLGSGYTADDSLRRRILAHARRRLGAAVAPKSITFVSDLPHTRSGKIMRRLLLARELGLPEGDVSALEVAGSAEPR
mgnify:CR=1 FL=1